MGPSFFGQWNLFPKTSKNSQKSLIQPIYISREWITGRSWLTPHFIKRDIHVRIINSNKYIPLKSIVVAKLANV